MNRDEFKLWFDDLKNRLPETAAFFASLDQRTRDDWFEVFEPYELCDALEANKRIWRSGEGLAKYQRDQLGSMFIRELAHVKYERQRAAGVRSKTLPDYIGSGASDRVTHDSEMGFVYRRVTARMADYRSEHGEQCTPPDLIRQWCEEQWRLLEK
jgi:hypothetical protein